MDAWILEGGSAAFLIVFSSLLFCSLPLNLTDGSIVLLHRMVYEDHVLSPANTTTYHMGIKVVQPNLSSIELLGAKCTTMTLDSTSIQICESISALVGTPQAVVAGSELLNPHSDHT